MSHHESAARGPDARMVDRLLFFSDAVFAIVLTLLALELRPPANGVGSEQELLNEIVGEGRLFASFIISFALGSAFWLAHMRTSRLLVRFDWLAAGVNLFHLLTVALLPFAAALLGQHIASAVAFAGYSAIIVLVSFSGTAFWLAATRDKGRLVGGMGARQRIAGAVRSSAIGWAFAGGLVLMGFGHLDLARFCWVLLFPQLLLARLIAGKSAAAATATA